MMTNMRTRIKHWAWTGIVIPRWALVLKYLIFVYWGYWAIVAGIPAFDITAPPGWAVIWGSLMVLSGAISAIAATRLDLEKIERWSVGFLLVLVLGYIGSLNVLAYSSNLANYQALAAGITGLFVLPLARFFYLASQAGKKKVPVNTVPEITE